MASKIFLAIVGLAVVAMLATVSSAKPASINICNPKLRDAVTAENVEDGYWEIMQLGAEGMTGLFEKSMSKYHNQLESAGSDAVQRKSVILEHADKICSSIDILKDMSLKLIKLFR